METKERILIIEDSEDIITFLTESILHPNGYDTLVSRDGQDGLRRALEERPDLILLDLNLPRMTGMEILKVLQERGSDTPVILMTFYGSEEIAVEAFRLGVKNYIVKPFKSQEVIEAIEDALGEGRLRQAKERLTDELMRTNKQLEQRVRELTMVYEITQAMAKLMDLETLLSRMVEASVFLSKAEEGMLFLLDAETQELHLRAAKGVGEKYAQGLRLRADDSLIGKVVQTGEPLRVASAEHRLELKVKTGYLVNSLLYVPLKLRDEIRGVLGVSNRVSDRAFSSADQHRLNILADHAVIALENARLYQAEQRRAFQLAMTSHLSQRISSILELDALLSEVVELLKQSFGYYYAQVLLRHKRDQLVMREGTGEIGQSIKESLYQLPIDDQTIVGWSANHGETLCVNSVRREPRFRPHELLPATMAELAVPLRAGSEVIGVLDIHSDEEKAFDFDDEIILQMLGDQIAVAIQNAVSYQRMRKQAEVLNTLTQIPAATISAESVDEMLKKLMKGINGILPVEAGSLLLIDDATKELEFKIALHGRREKLAQFRLQLGQGIAGWVAQHGEPLLVDDVREDPRYYPQIAQAIGFEARSILCVPLKTKQRVIGVIEVINRLGRGADTRFTEDDLEILTALAAPIALALDSARLYEMAQRQITDAQRETLASMSQYVYEPLKAFATNTYALKAGIERGTITCADDTLDQLLTSMERRIAQMASLTQVLNTFASPDSTPQDWESLEQTLDKLKAKYGS